MTAEFDDEETRTTVLAALAEMRTLIDEIIADPADTDAVEAAAAALDRLQTDISTAIGTPPAEPVP